MKPSDFVKYGAGLAFNTAYNYIKPNSQEPIGSQIQLYRNMKFYMKGRHASRSKTVVKKRRKGRGSGGIGGVLGPPIPKTGPVSKFSKFAKYGSHGQDETFGTIDKDEMVYIGLTSAKCTGGGTEPSGTASWSGSIVYHVAAALLRNILKKEFQEDICRHDQLITAKVAYGNYPNIHFIWKEDPLGTVVPTFGTQMIKLGADTTTAGTLAQNQRMFGDVARDVAQYVISAADFGGVVGTNASGLTRSVYGYYITSGDANSTNVQVEMSNIRRLDNQYLVAYSTAEIALQNVTVADSTADASGVRLDNRIDSNPLDCAVYKFKTPYPRVRLDGFSNYPVGVFASNASNPQGPAGNNADSVLVPDNSYFLQYDTNADGVIVPNGTLSRDWRQLPLPDKFYGCTGHARFKLHPGQIRKGLLKFKFEGSLNNLIKGFRVIAEGDSTRYNSKDSFGTSLLFAMEKVMSTGTDVSVTVNYQVSYWSGAYMKRQKGEVMQSYNHTGTYAPSTAAGYGNYGPYTAGTYTGGAD